MNKDDEKDIVRIKGKIKVGELELIDETIGIQEKAFRMLRDDTTWKLYCGEFATQMERFSQMALCQTKIEVWQSIRKKVVFADNDLVFANTNNKARDKLFGFILQLKQFKESDLLKMQAYLKRLYVEKKDLKTNEIIGDLNALVRYVKGFLYGTK